MEPAGVSKNEPTGWGTLKESCTFGSNCWITAPKQKCQPAATMEPAVQRFFPWQSGGREFRSRGLMSPLFHCNPEPGFGPGLVKRTPSSYFIIFNYFPQCCGQILISQVALNCILYEQTHWSQRNCLWSKVLLSGSRDIRFWPLMISSFRGIVFPCIISVHLFVIVGLVVRFTTMSTGL